MVIIVIDGYRWISMCTSTVQWLSWLLMVIDGYRWCISTVQWLSWLLVVTRGYLWLLVTLRIIYFKTMVIMVIDGYR